MYTSHTGSDIKTVLMSECILFRLSEVCIVNARAATLHHRGNLGWPDCCSNSVCDPLPQNGNPVQPALLTLLSKVVCEVGHLLEVVVVAGRLLPVEGSLHVLKSGCSWN